MLLPLIVRALFGEKLKQLCAEIGPHVTRSIAFFLAACRHGGVTSFQSRQLALDSLLGRAAITTV